MFKKKDIHNADLMKELQTELDEINRSISSLRKKGINTKTVEYMTMNLPAKIKMAAITNSDSDVDGIRDVYRRVLAEIDFLEREYMEEQNRLAYLEQLLQKAHDLLEKRQLRESLPLYYEIRNFYKALSLESRYKVFEKCVKFYSEFQELAKRLFSE